MSKTPLNEDEKREFCDGLVTACAVAMTNTAGASISMAIDRLLTYAVAQAVSIDGSKATAKTFRKLADRIDAGVFARFDPNVPARRN